MKNRGKLVLEQEQRGVQMDLTSMSEAEAVSLLRAATPSMGTHRLDLNYGAGSAPTVNRGDALVIPPYLREMLRLSNSGVGIGSIQRTAEIVGARWYWTYATKRACAELEAEYGAERADEIFNDEDRTRFNVRRGEILEWIIAELFGE